MEPYFGPLMAPFVGLALGLANGLAITFLRLRSCLATIAMALISRAFRLQSRTGC